MYIKITLKGGVMPKGLELPVLEGNKRTADGKGSESFIAAFMVA